MRIIFNTIAFLMLAQNIPAAASPKRPEFQSNWQMGSNEAFVAQTSDGWVLPLYRFSPRIASPVGQSLPPVVLFHGMGANRFNLAQTGPSNLAVWLATRGRDVFVELRGAGRSVT